MKLIASAVFGASLLLTATASTAGVTLVNVDPVFVDTMDASVSGAQTANIDFINYTSNDVDLYWIDYSGDRVFYKDIAADSSYIQTTYITHPWLIALAGSGDTPMQGSGTLITAFLSAVTPAAFGGDYDIANIGSVPEPATWATMLLGVGLAGGALRRKRQSTLAA